MKTTKRRFVFGEYPERPRLKRGWKFHESPTTWLTVIDPSGTRWFFGEDLLTETKACGEGCSVGKLTRPVADAIQ